MVCNFSKNITAPVLVDNTALIPYNYSKVDLNHESGLLFRSFSISSTISTHNFINVQNHTRLIMYLISTKTCKTIDFGDDRLLFF